MLQTLMTLTKNCLKGGVNNYSGGDTPAKKTQERNAGTGASATQGKQHYWD